MITDRSTEHEKTVSMISVYTRYHENVGNLTGDMKQRAWISEKLDNLGRMVKKIEVVW